MERGVLKWPRLVVGIVENPCNICKKLKRKWNRRFLAQINLLLFDLIFDSLFRRACEKWKKTNIDFSVSFDVSLPDRSIHSSIQLRACLSSGVKVANGIRTQQTKLSPQPKLEVFSSGNFRLNESLRKVKFLDGEKHEKNRFSQYQAYTHWGCIPLPWTVESEGSPRYAGTKSERNNTYLIVGKGYTKTKSMKLHE